jgi:hypothetical protein
MKLYVKPGVEIHRKVDVVCKLTVRNMATVRNFQFLSAGCNFHPVVK